MVLSAIDTAITDVWEIIKKEYDNSWLYREDSLKSSFYHHLRSQLGDEFFDNNNLRIFTEYYLEGNYNADLIIAELDATFEYINNVLVLIEFKYKNKNASLDNFYSDIRKIGNLVKHKDLKDTYFYFVSIHEDYWPTGGYSWLDGRQKRWAKGKLTELNGFYDEARDQLVIEVVKH